MRAAVDAVLAETGANDEEDAIRTLLSWIDADRKATPLKVLQGLIWREGYERSDFTAHVYVDAFDRMGAWHRAGVPLYVYSSGSVAAQQLLFRHSVFGDLSSWFAGNFDTRMGAKREADAYHRISQEIGVAASHILFLSDVELELDAAHDAGLDTVQLVRADTRPESHGRHKTAATFRDIAL